MKLDSTWGGGPEIVALSNCLKLPIHVYELCWIDKVDKRLSGKDIGHGKWGVRRMACFGSPKFDDKGCLNILSCDCRFPDIRGKKNIKSGNHFMAMFPSDGVGKEQAAGGNMKREKAGKRAGQGVEMGQGGSTGRLSARGGACGDGLSETLGKFARET